METQPTQTAQKKKLPGWLKFLIVLVIIGAGLMLIASAGVLMIGHWIKKEGGEKLGKVAIEKMIEASAKQSGKKVDVEFGNEGMVVKNKETGEEAKVQLNNQGFSVQNQQGEQFAINAGPSAKADLPSDVPAFSPATVQGSMTMGPNKVVTLETTEPSSKVVDFYKTELPSKGWSSVYSNEEGGAFSSQLSKGANNLMVSVAPDDSGKVEIVLTYFAQ